MNLKRITAAVSAIVLAGGLVSSVPVKDSVSAADIKGDINGDGVLSKTDLVNFSQFMLGKRNLTSSANADMNGDNVLNVIDLTMLKKAVLEAEPVIAELRINEVCAANSSCLTDSNGENPDWIEIYNSSNKAISLEGYGLSDSTNKPFKWTFGNVVIQPGSYLVVFASDGNVSSGNELHASFKLSSDGETVILTAPDSTTVDTFSFTYLSDDVTASRYPNASDIIETTVPTPGRSNTGAQIVDIVAPPVFSVESGLYSEAFSLDISVPQGYTVYYTTDSSTPTQQSARYTGAITVADCDGNPNKLCMIGNTSVYSTWTPTVTVDKLNVIKAVAYDSKGNASEIVTKSYLVDNDIAQKYPDVPIVSISTDEANLFDYDTGIFMKGAVYDANTTAAPGGKGGFVANDGSTPCNYNQRGREWERAAHVDIIESDGKLKLSQDCGIRTMGGWSRAQLQKSIRFYARSEYGKGKFNEKLIPGLTKDAYPDEKIDVYNTFILRNGGNAVDNIQFRDPWIQSIVADRSFATQGSRTCIAFINGEYWGTYALQEDFTSEFIETNYKIPEDDVVIIKVGSVDEGEEQDKTLYTDLINFATNNDLTTPENYAKISSMIDVQNFIDYYCTEIFISNKDWPNNNYRVWRSKTVTDLPYQDGKWRWMLYDTEFSMDIYNDGRNYQENTFTKAASSTSWGGSAFSNHTVLFAKLMKNADFKQQLATTMMDMINVNFSPDVALKALDEYAAIYNPLLVDHHERFGPSNVFQKYNSVPDYVTEKLNGIKSFVTNRCDYLPNIMKSSLSLTGNPVEVTLRVNNAQAGTIKINTVSPDLSSGSWTGKYFTGYPVTLTACAAEGYTFAGWSDGSTNPVITVSLSEALTMTANFR